MRKLWKTITAIIPEYGIIPVTLAFLFNSLVYGGARLIAGNWKHYNVESSLDRLIPFVPQTIVIYLGCYIFWIVNYILIARQDERSVREFFAGDFLSRCVCFVIYLVFPTTNIRPLTDGYGFWGDAMAWLYSVDAADNLFPSIHCLVSWFCFIGIRGRKEITVWYRGASCMMAALVFLSTLTTKQHVLLDVFGGIILAEICFQIGKKTVLSEVYGKICGRLEKKLFCRKCGRQEGEKADAE